MSLANELRIRSNGGHEGSQELEIMCGKAADEIERLERGLGRSVQRSSHVNDDYIIDELISVIRGCAIQDDGELRRDTIRKELARERIGLSFYPAPDPPIEGKKEKK